MANADRVDQWWPGVEPEPLGFANRRWRSQLSAALSLGTDTSSESPWNLTLSLPCLPPQRYNAAQRPPLATQFGGEEGGDAMSPVSA
jgi:hypothetical protein